MWFVCFDSESFRILRIRSRDPEKLSMWMLHWVIFFPANTWSVLWVAQQSNQPIEMSLVALHSCPTNENWQKDR